ncbi:MAG TPA: DUF2336 domain-containing protein [Xanthobacteraceae bacterium]|nr:DUF2336 domain-containing protein [Xanthobacteraceae bacterium]
MVLASDSLIADLESALSGDSQDGRTRTLRRVTDLFLNDAERLTEDQVKLFDDVLVLLIRKIETAALIELSRRLAPIDNSPMQVIRRLAWDDEIQIAGPVLSQSRRLSTGDLVEIAAAKGQAHLLAICERHELAEPVTDVILNRGDAEVVCKLAGNARARFSSTGYSLLVKDAQLDDRLAETVGLRFDIPPRLLRQLLERATETVRGRILALASPETRSEIQRAVSEIATAIGKVASAQRDFREAERLIMAMEKGGKLDERALMELVKERKYEEMTVALARLSSGSLKLIASLMVGLRNDALLVPCKAADLKWATTEAILRNRHANHKVSDEILQIARRDYERLSVLAAQRTLRFMQARDGSK